MSIFKSKKGQMTLALPKALTFRVNVGNDGIEKGLVAARPVDFGLPQGRLFRFTSPLRKLVVNSP
mgnify:CR=1 FL=1